MNVSKRRLIVSDVGLLFALAFAVMVGAGAGCAIDRQIVRGSVVCSSNTPSKVMTDETKRVVVDSIQPVCSVPFSEPPLIVYCALTGTPSMEPMLGVDSVVVLMQARNSYDQELLLDWLEEQRIAGRSSVITFRCPGDQTMSKLHLP